MIGKQGFQLHIKNHTNHLKSDKYISYSFQNRERVSDLLQIQVVVDAHWEDKGENFRGHDLLGDAQLLVSHCHLVDACNNINNQR